MDENRNIVGLTPYVFAFANNRRTSGESYDNDGRVTAENASFQYDAPGRMIYTSEGAVYETTLDYGGDGRETKRSQRVWDENLSDYGDWESVYLVTSSVLRQTVSETTGTGAKKTTYVVAGGTVVAAQFLYGTAETVGWKHTDASGLSTRGFKLEELDALGNNVGTIPPVNIPEIFANLLSLGQPLLLVNPDSGDCTLDGIYVSCSMARRMLQNGSALPAHLAPYLHDPALQIRDYGMGLFGVHEIVGYRVRNPNDDTTSSLRVSTEEDRIWGWNLYSFGWGVSTEPGGEGGAPQGNECKRFADRVDEIAAKHTKVGSFVDELARHFIGVASSDIDDMRANANTNVGERFTAHGFLPALYDSITENQARHFIGGLIAGYNLGSVLGATVMNHGEHDQGDLRLNEISIPLGAALTNPTPKRTVQAARTRDWVTYKEIPASPGFKGLADKIRKLVCGL